MYSLDVFGSGHSFEPTMAAVGITNILRWEVFMAKPYKDLHKGAPKNAIGYGHVEGGDNEPKVIPDDMVITEREARAIFNLDLHDKLKFIETNVKVPINTYMRAALASLTFNCGRGNVSRGRIIGLLNDEKYVAACAAFHDHRFAHENDVLTEKNGLIVRRGTEMGIFMTKIN